jgi:hypothetical protein
MIVSPAKAGGHISRIALRSVGCRLEPVLGIAEGDARAPVEQLPWASVKGIVA